MEKIADGVIVVHLCMPSVMHYISTKFCEIILNSIKVIYRADTTSLLKIIKGHNSAKNVGGVTIVNLCKSSRLMLYICAFVKLSQTVSKK